MWNGYHWMYGGWWGMAWMMGAAIIMFVLLIWLFSRRSEEVPLGPMTDEKSPMDILRERFARGEIDVDEFDNRLHRLEEDEEDDAQG